MYIYVCVQAGVSFVFMLHMIVVLYLLAVGYATTIWLEYMHVCVTVHEIWFLYGFINICLQLAHVQINDNILLHSI